MDRITIELPKIIEARDYHEFDSLKYMLNQQFDVDHFIKFEEISAEVPYVAVFYTGQKPDKSGIDKMLKEKGIERA